MINYVVKTEDLDYFVYCAHYFMAIGTEFMYNGRKCRVISRNGKV